MITAVSFGWARRLSALHPPIPPVGAKASATTGAGGPDPPTTIFGSTPSFEG